MWPSLVFPDLFDRIYLWIIHELYNSHLSFGNIRLRIIDYILGKLPLTINGYWLTVNRKKVWEITVQFFEPYQVNQGWELAVIFKSATSMKYLLIDYSLISD